MLNNLRNLSRFLKICRNNLHIAITETLNKMFLHFSPILSLLSLKIPEPELHLQVLNSAIFNATGKKDEFFMLFPLRGDCLGTIKK